MLNSFLNILFPQSCPVCDGPSSEHRTAPICSTCWQGIKGYDGPTCMKCGKPLESELSNTCGDCISHEPAFISARSFGLYEGTLRKALNLLKYHGIKRLAGPIADLFPLDHIPAADVVMPVPLFGKRLRQREFNQSAVLGRYLALRIGKHSAEGRPLPLVLNNLMKTRDTMPQVGMSASERKKNIRNAFSVMNAEQVREKDVLLVDDVQTTGATVRECSRVLKRAGAGNVFVLTVAHGVMD